MTAYTSTQTGDWDDALTWGGGGFPTTADTAAISAGDIVSVKGAELCGDITVDPSGSLRFDGQSDTVAAVMTLDNGSTITNNGAVDATATGTTGPARIVGASLEVMAGTDWTWDNQVWEIVNMDIQFNMAVGGGITQSVTFKTTLSTIDDLDVQTGATVQFDVANCTVGGATVSGGILLLEEAISFTSFGMASGTTIPAAAGTAIACSGNWSYTAGTWTGNSGTLTLTGSGNLVHSVGGNSLNSLVHSGATTTTLTGLVRIVVTHIHVATTTITGSFTIQLSNATLATFVFPSGAVHTGVTYQMYISASGTLTAPGLFNNLQMQGSSDIFTLGATLTCAGHLRLDNPLGIVTLDTSGTNYAVSCDTFNVDTSTTLTGNDSVITSTGTFTMAGGTFTFTGSTGRLDVNNFTQASGTTTGGVAGSDVQCSGNWTVSGGTFTAQRVALTLTASTNLAHGLGFAARLYSLDHAAGVTTTLTVNLGVGTAHTFTATSHMAGGGLGCVLNSTTLTFPSGATMASLTYTISAGSSTLTAPGSFNNLLFTGNVTYTLGDSLTCTGTLVLDDPSGACTLDCATFALDITSTFTVDVLSVLDLGTSTGHVITANFTPLGDIDAASSTFTCAGNVDLSNINFQEGTGTIVMNGAGKTLTSGGASNGFNSITISESCTFAGVGSNMFHGGTLTVAAAKTFTINADLTLYDGQIANFTNNNIIDGSAQMFFFIAGEDVNRTLGTVGTLQVNLSFWSLSSITADRSIILGGNLVTTGDIDVASLDGTFTCSLDTSGTDYSLTCAVLTLTDAEGVLIANASAIACTDLTVTAGTITAGSSTITASGSINLNGGTFTQGTSTLVMSGTAAFIVLHNETIYGFTVAGANTVALTVAGGSTLVMNGPFTSTSGGTFDTQGELVHVNGPTAIAGFDNSGGTITGTQTFYFGLQGSVSFDNLGTVENSITVEAISGATNTFTLINDAFNAGADISIRNNGGTNMIFDTGANLGLTTVTSISVQSGTLQTNASTIAFTTTLTIAGTLTAGSAAISCADLTLTGTMTAGSSVTTASGDVDLSVGTFTEGTSALVMTGTAKTLDLGSNAFYDFITTGTILLLNNNCAVGNDLDVLSNTLDTAALDLTVTGTSAVTGTLQTGANADGATWDFANTVTVAGTAQISVTSGSFNFVLGSKTLSVRDQLAVANHAARGNAVFTTGGAGHVNQRTALTGGQISMGRRVGWNGLYIQDCIIAQGTDMRGAWFGKGNLGVIRRTPSRSVQGIGPLGVRYG